MSYRSRTSARQKRGIQIEARERKICTVAFFDIVQSTALIEDLDPEDALDRLGPSVEMIMETCEDFGASVRFVGDGALAVFGFPLADENHCIRAVEAGLTVVKRISEMQEDRVDIRVGIHSGPVLFGNLSHSNFDELTLTGPVVNLADKIQSAARINQVTVSTTVVENVQEMFVSQKAGVTHVSGMDQPLQLFEVTERDHSVSRWKTRISRGLSPFMGRNNDIETLKRAWTNSTQGKGSAIALVGAAGIGKSRLLHEFIKTIDQTDARILEVSATALDEKAAYAPLTRAIKQRLDISASEDPAKSMKKVSAFLDHDAPEFLQHVSALQLVLHSASEDPAWAALGPKVRQETLQDALLTLVLGMAEGMPFTIIFEDIHWADRHTVSLCHRLAGKTAANKALLILTSRTLESLEDIDTQTIHLGPLDNESSRELVSRLLSIEKENTNHSAFVEKICGQTPLFIEEVVKNLKSFGDTTGGTVGTNFKVPESVQPLIAQRIDALPPAGRETLQIASVIGSEFSVDLLKQLLQHEGLEDVKSMAFLTKLDLLQDTDTHTGKFRHALIQQVAYSSLPKRRLRHLHSLSFEFLNDQEANSNLSAMSSVAFHAEQSQRWIEAAEAFDICGHLALERAAFDDGIMHFRKVIDCAKRLDGDSLKVAKLNIKAYRGLRDSYGPKGDFAQILKIMAEVERLSTKLGDDTSALGAGIDQVIMTTIVSEIPTAIAKGKEMLDLAIRRDAPGYIATAAFALSQAYWFGGDFENAAAVSNRFEHFYALETDRLTKSTTGTVSVLGLGTYANALSQLGHFEEARRVCRKMGLLARQTDKPYDIAFHAISVGICALHAGEYEKSRESLTFALQTNEGANIDVLCPFLSAPLARACAALGDINAAKRAIAMGNKIAIAAGVPAFIAHLLAAEIDVLSEAEPSDVIAEMEARLIAMSSRNGYGALLAGHDVP